MAALACHSVILELSSSAQPINLLNKVATGFFNT